MKKSSLGVLPVVGVLTLGKALALAAGALVLARAKTKSAPLPVTSSGTGGPGKTGTSVTVVPPTALPGVSDHVAAQAADAAFGVGLTSANAFVTGLVAGLAPSLGISAAAAAPFQAEASREIAIEWKNKSESQKAAVWKGKA